jgi:hypothetical protein
MQQVEATIASIARNRVRNTLLRFTQDGPRVVSLSEVAAHADLTLAAARACMVELEAGGPFAVTRLGTDDELRWRVN